MSANENLQALAIDQLRFEKPLPLQTLMAYSDGGEILNLTEQVDENGRLGWTAPEGNWTLYAVFQGWHGKMVERAAPGGEGNVIDHFSAAPIRNYLAKFDEAFAGRQTGALRAFFNDSYEVDYAAIHANPRNSLWRDFPALNQYIARAQAFLQSGLPDNDILLCFPIYDRFASPGQEMLEHFDGGGRGMEGAAVKAIADTLQDSGYGFDFISDRQIQQLKVEGGWTYPT